tara:strand:+ start:78 stop:434 length:357 start_codon:yes stop_codon:yes gene_type:complete
LALSLEEALRSVNRYVACEKISAFHRETTSLANEITKTPWLMSFEEMSKDLNLCMYDALVDVNPRLAAKLAIKIRTFLYTVTRGGSLDHGDIYRRARESTLRLVEFLTEKDSPGSSSP